MATLPEENTVVVRRFWEEVFNQGNLEVADKLFASDHVLHEPDLPEEERGPDVIKGIVVLFRKISPDIQVAIEDEIAEGGTVVSRWTASGTQADELSNAGTTGDEVTVSGISIFRVSDGEIKETWQQSQRLEAQALVPPEEIRDWLLADQLILDLVGRESVSPDERWIAGSWEEYSYWRKFCYYCGCCKPPEEPMDEPWE